MRHPRRPTPSPTLPPPDSALAPAALHGGLFCGDNLELIQALPDACLDFIYLDPPYFTGRNRSRRGRGGAFADVWSGGLDEYLGFLEPRLVGCRRLLKKTASLCVHLDFHAGHYVKVRLDRHYGMENFLNEIIWSYRSGGTGRRWFPRKHDTLLVYARQAGRHTFHPLRQGDYRTEGLKTDQTGRPYKNTLRGRLYFDARGPLVTDVWEIPFLSTVSDERTGYPTQKPVALLRRLIEAFTNPGDLVFDPFCGSGTALVAAEQSGRTWLGCDRAAEAVRIAHRRLETAGAQVHLRTTR